MFWDFLLQMGVLGEKKEKEIILIDYVFQIV